MSKKDIEQAIVNVLTDAWCPQDLAKDAAKVVKEISKPSTPRWVMTLKP